MTPSEPNVPPGNGPTRADGAPPVLTAEAKRSSGSGRQVFAVVLSLCLALFLVAGFVSLVDDSLVLLFGVHFLTMTSLILFGLEFLVAVAVYGLMGLTPMIPKRVFLPVALFHVAGMFIALLVVIYHFDLVLQIDWVLSLGQVLLGLGLLWWLRGGLNFRWLIVEPRHLGDRAFSWLNLTVFLLLNVFVLLPALVASVALCATLAVNHFTGGFMAVHPGGLTVQVRKYVRNDGKLIELFPMAHVADAGFYQQVAQTFPTNSVILMEGVTDRQNLLTNKLSYKRMAKTLGLSEQRKEFVPTRGEMIPADVDVAEFSKVTIDFLNLITLFHAKGVTASTVSQMLQFVPPPDFEAGLFQDLLTKRNQHLLQEIQTQLPQSDNLMVPWGVAHMPGIAGEIQKSGFRLDGSRDYTVIRFHFVGKK